MNVNNHIPVNSWLLVMGVILSLSTDTNQCIFVTAQPFPFKLQALAPLSVKINFSYTSTYFRWLAYKVWFDNLLG